MRFRVGRRNGLRPSVQIIITTSVHFVVLREIDDEVLVLARFKREVENGLDLHECTKQCQHVINNRHGCARKG